MNGTLGWVVEMWKTPALWLLLAIQAFGLVTVIQLSPDPTSGLFGFFGGVIAAALSGSLRNRLDERAQVAEGV